MPEKKEGRKKVKLLFGEKGKRSCFYGNYF